jgi:hypothetical protein
MILPEGMAMRTVAYAVFDAETGEVVGIHVESSALDSSPEEIAQIADIQGSRRLRAIRINADEVLAGPSRVVDNELRAWDGGENWGSAEVEAVSEISEPKERRYIPMPPASPPGQTSS